MLPLFALHGIFKSTLKPIENHLSSKRKTELLMEEQEKEL
jgi:hypothetical protein